MYAIYKCGIYGANYEIVWVCYEKFYITCRSKNSIFFKCLNLHVISNVINIITGPISLMCTYFYDT